MERIFVPLTLSVLFTCFYSPLVEAKVLKLPTVSIDILVLGGTNLSSKHIGQFEVIWSVAADRPTMAMDDEYPLPIIKWETDHLIGPIVINTNNDSQITIKETIFSTNFYHRNPSFLVSVNPKIKIEGYETCAIPSFNNYYTLLDLGQIKENPVKDHTTFGYAECGLGAALPAFFLKGEKEIAQYEARHLRCHLVGLREKGPGYDIVPFEEAIERWKKDCDTQSTIISLNK